MKHSLNQFPQYNIEHYSLFSWFWKTRRRKKVGSAITKYQITTRKGMMFQYFFRNIIIWVVIVDTDLYIYHFETKINNIDRRK